MTRDSAHALVTGAAGFIGSHLQDECLRLGWRVTAVDLRAPEHLRAADQKDQSGSLAGRQLDVICGDLLELDLDSLLADVDVVFNLAGTPSVRASWGVGFDRYLRNNVAAHQRLLHAARYAPKLKRYVLASSSSVYGAAEFRATRENSPLAPASPYGASKVMAEHLAAMYHDTFRVPAVVVRLFSVYGPRQRQDMAFAQAIHASVTGRPFRMSADGLQTRDFTYVADAIAGLMLAAENGHAGDTYNIGTGFSTSLADALAMLRELGCDVDVEAGLPGDGDAEHTLADIGHAEATLGYHPVWALRASLEQQLRWHQEDHVVL